MTRVALYARVSTRDKNQDPAVQLAVLRAYCSRRGWTELREYVDRAPAGDRAQRREWRRLLEHAHRRDVDLVLVVQLDRAFRSTLDALTTLQGLEHSGVGFAVAGSPELDTTSPTGQLLFTMLAAFAELERGLIAARVRDGMAAAKRRGVVLGRPAAKERDELRHVVEPVLDAVLAGEISRAAAARTLRVSRSTVRAMLRGHGKETA